MPDLVPPKAKALGLFHQFGLDGLIVRPRMHVGVVLTVGDQIELKYVHHASMRGIVPSTSKGSTKLEIIKNE
jgi:hypothetical protein